MVLDKNAVKFFDVGDRGAVEGDLLNYIHPTVIAAARRQQQLVVLYQAVLRGHKHGAPRASIADLKTEDVAVKGDRALQVPNVETDVAEGCDFGHKPSEWNDGLLIRRAALVNGVASGPIISSLCQREVRKGDAMKNLCSRLRCSAAANAAQNPAADGVDGFG
jgi:hypothetical protein